jgi:rod shape-determining protein MreC
MGFPKIRPFTAGPSAAYFWTITLAFVLTVSGSTVKNSIASFMVGTAYAPFSSLNSGIKDVLSVYRKNRELLSRVAELTARNARLIEANRENENLRKKLDFAERSELAVIPAEVVGPSSGPVRGEIWISAGRGKTLPIDSPVITPDGIVGYVSGYAVGMGVVRSLLDGDCRVAAVDRRSRTLGVIQWLSGSYLTFNYVPIDGDVQVGDTIVASGWSDRFPEGLPIGQVHDVHVDSSAFFLRVEVKPFVHFETLEEVFVVRRLPDDTTAEIQR